MKIIELFFKLLEKKYLLFFCYVFFLFISIFMFSYLMSVEHHAIVDDFGNLNISLLRGFPPFKRVFGLILP